MRICISCHRVSDKACECGCLISRPVRVVKLWMIGEQVPEPKLLILAGLTSIARERGYSQGWIAHKYKAIYGEWPKTKVEPRNPSPGLMWWIRKENQRYAKGMNSDCSDSK